VDRVCGYRGLGTVHSVVSGIDIKIAHIANGRRRQACAGFYVPGRPSSTLGPLRALGTRVATAWACSPLHALVALEPLGTLPALRPGSTNRALCALVTLRALRAGTGRALAAW
jgi:hypothetical protein